MKNYPFFACCKTANFSVICRWRSSTLVGRCGAEREKENEEDLCVVCTGDGGKCEQLSWKSHEKTFNKTKSNPKKCWKVNTPKLNIYQPVFKIQLADFLRLRALVFVSFRRFGRKLIPKVFEKLLSIYWNSNFLLRLLKRLNWINWNIDDFSL